MSAASPLEFIDVVITRDIEVVSRVGFGTLLFVGETTGAQGPKVAQYANFDAVAAVFAEGDPEYHAAELYFSQEEKPERLYIGIKEEYDTWVEAIQEIKAINNDWYGVAIASLDKQDNLDVSAYIQTQNKIFFALSADSDIPDDQADDDLASELLDLNRDRTALFYHAGATLTLMPNLALVGKVLPLDPGAATFAWQTLSGVPSDTSLDEVSRGTLQEKRATYYTRVAGNNITFEGQVSQAGVFIDMIQGTDFIKFRMAEDLVAALSNASKIPYVGGDTVIEARIRSRLAQAAAQGIITDDFEVNVPPASDQSTDNRVARIYDGVTFSAQFQGAVHRVRIRGSIAV